VERVRQTRQARARQTSDRDPRSDDRAMRRCGLSRPGRQAVVVARRVPCRWSDLARARRHDPARGARPDQLQPTRGGPHVAARQPVRHTMKQLFASAVVIVALHPAALADELAMADVRALDTSHHYAELLASADRVKPSARANDWQKLVTGAAIHVLTD